MYLEYWGLKKHPFNNVPDPEMYFDMHQSVDQAVSEVLFAIEEGNEMLAVVIGPVGVGKTMTLRIVLDSLDHARHRVAFITNPDMTFPQLLREMVGQLEGKICEEKRKEKLLDLFAKLVEETGKQSKRVVIFIDEGNVIKPHNLESLRLLTTMQDEQQNPFTIVLAGQPELSKRLEDPRRESLFQRVGVYCKLEGIDSLATMRDYVDYRLERAGLRDRQVFTDAAYAALWAGSDSGMPRVINKLGKLCLKSGEVNEMSELDERVVNGVASRFMRSYRRRKEREVPKQPQKPESRTETLEVEIKSKTEVIQEKPSPNPSLSAPMDERPTERLSQPQPTRRLSRDELEGLASRLATERVKDLKDVVDPFEAWEQIRDEILEQMLNNQD